MERPQAPPMHRLEKGAGANSTLRLGLLLCAFGFHCWSFLCKDGRSERNTRRDCTRCEFSQYRDSSDSPYWLNYI